MLNRVVRIVRKIRLAMLAAVLLGSAVPSAQAQLISYDDFTAGRIDEARWTGRQFTTRTGGTGDLLEIQREVTKAQALVLQSRVVGGTKADGGDFSVDNALVFRRSQAINEIVFDVTVQRADIRSCGSGQDAAAGARGVFPLFNDGNGDVVAIIGVMASPGSAAGASELDVVASLVQRTAAGDVALGTLALGPATANSAVRLRTRWDAAKSRVRFQKDADPVMAIDYLNPVIASADGPKYLATLTSVSDCTAHGTSAAVVALFDNVRINP